MAKTANTPLRHLCDQPRLFERHNCITNHQKIVEKLERQLSRQKMPSPQAIYRRRERQRELTLIAQVDVLV